MACFIAPMSLAVVTTLFRKKIPENLKIGWLNVMICGGVIMLAVEHIAHGEVVLYPPFLTAMQNPADISTMLLEMATIGGGMTIAIVFTWIVMVLVYNKRTQSKKNMVKQ
ncbi:MAG: hypothetical protein V1769_07040 [Thermoplasmatota archaeon]